MEIISNSTRENWVIRQYMEQDVYEALQDRGKLIFKEFDNKCFLSQSSIKIWINEWPVPSAIIGLGVPTMSIS